MKKLARIRERLKDERGGEIIFLSHCILNINARYFGGAFRRGSVAEIISDTLEKGYGIVQIGCPERLAWGGILKRFMWLAFNSKNSFIYGFKCVLLPLFMFYTRLRYKMLASALVSEMLDYTRAGYKVIGVVGVDGSPSCGVNTKLDVTKSFEFFASSDIENLNREEFNYTLYKKCAMEGSGLFISVLKKLIKRKRLDIPVYSYSLISEMHGVPCEIWRN